MLLSVKFPSLRCFAAPYVGRFLLVWQRTLVHAEGEEVCFMLSALSSRTFKANTLHRTKVIKTTEAQLETFDLFF